LTLLLATLLVQACAAVAAALPKLFRQPVSSAAGFVGLVFATFFWFPARWAGMELVSLAYMAGFLFFEFLVFLMIWSVVVLLRQARDAAAGR
jgi:hypothetical protein